MTRRVIQRTPNLGITVRLQPLMPEPVAAPVVQQPAAGTPGAPYWFGYHAADGTPMTSLYYSEEGFYYSEMAPLKPEPGAWVGYIDGVGPADQVQWSAVFHHKTLEWVYDSMFGTGYYEVIDDAIIDLGTLPDFVNQADPQLYRNKSFQLLKYVYAPSKSPEYSFLFIDMDDNEWEFVLPSLAARGPMVFMTIPNVRVADTSEGVQLYEFQTASGVLTLTASLNGQTLGTLTWQYDSPMSVRDGNQPI